MGPIHLVCVFNLLVAPRDECIEAEYIFCFFWISVDYLSENLFLLLQSVVVSIDGHIN